MISLYDILEAANGQLFGEPAAELFSGFAFDAYSVSESCLYVALRTDAGDGHSDIGEAMARGATGVLCTRPPEVETSGVTIILVKDTQTALTRWSYNMIRKFGVQVVAVTGSTGRTSTVQAISRVLETRYTVLSSEDCLPNRLLLPITTARLRPGHRIMVVEIAPNQPGEMSEFLLSAQPQVGVVLRTPMTPSDHFESADQVVEESALLIEYLPASGCAVLNYDDDRVRAMATRTRARPVSVGIDSFGADLMAYNLVEGLSGTGFDVRYGSQRLVGRWTPLLGRHHLAGVLAAAAVGGFYDVPLDDALRALTTVEALPGRMCPLNGSGGALLVDFTHNADPDGLVEALAWIRRVRIEGQRALVILGDLDNLGASSQREHRILGQQAAEAADTFVTVGADAAYAGRAALDHGMSPQQVAITHSIQDVISQMDRQTWVGTGDIVLVAGGAGARMELLTRALLASPEDAKRLTRTHQTPEVDRALRPTRSNWVEIDLDALAHNVRGLKMLIGDGVTLFAVVKANAYGHGAVAAARTALLNGAGALATASIHEAAELRAAGIDAPILVMSYTPTQEVRQAVRQEITLTLYDLEMARAYDRAAREAGGSLRLHVKIDTGMGRLGVLASGTVAFYRQLLNLSRLELEGVYTHFSTADDDLSYVQEQLIRFKGVLAPLRAAGFTFRYVHAANSAATLRLKEAHFNAVRCGLAMYGVSPSDQARIPHDFRPVLAWKTQVAQVKTLPPGHPVGYGNTYVTEGEERIAVLPIGYSDGLRRAPGYWGHVLVRGQVAPIIGRVSMEKTVVNVSHIPGVAIGDEVVVIGTQGDLTITADDIARRLGTISYEVLTMVAPRYLR
ncbi:MAG: alanine racemase [Anaerolineae bacterium]|nr:alanine racemase [Anaerolineae bacterium]NUQ05456.1 alanine racemase [Anaerolineae bacterium]